MASDAPAPAATPARGAVGALVPRPEKAEKGAGELMAPPPPRAKRKREELVLEEDEWLEAIEAIVRRDYFPDLPKLESELEWLEAVRSKDPVLIRQAQANIAARRAGLKTPAGRTPATFATPATVAAATPGLGGATPGLGPAGDGEGAHAAHAAAGSQAPKMSLDQFMARHTSEDNASFKQILEGINKRRRERYAWAHRGPAADQPALEGGRPLDGFGTSGQPGGALVALAEAPANAVFYPREGQPLTERELGLQVQGPPKEISTAATRLPGAFSTAADSADDVNLNPTPKPVRGDGYSRVSTPAFTPGPEAPPPLTWGGLGATPARVLEDDAGPRFHVPQRTAKDLLAHRLADGARLKLQKRAALMSPSALAALQRQTPRPRTGTGAGRQTPGGSGGRGVAMSPAAHRLASSLRARAPASADSLLRASYSGSALRQPRRPDTAATPALVAGPAANETPAILHSSSPPRQEASSPERRARAAALQAFEPGVARSQALRAFEQTAARRDALAAFGKITDDLLQL